MPAEPPPAAAPAVPPKDLLRYEFVCKQSDLPEGARRCLTLPSSGRVVMLLNLGGRVFCMDQACYHHGGPLLNGDIEELGGKVTIKCPWHAFQIAVETGEGLYMGVDMVRSATGRVEATPPRVKSKGLKQRTHFVELREGDVYVADSSTLGDMFQSDIYAFRHVNIPERQEGEVRIHSKFSS